MNPRDDGRAALRALGVIPWGEVQALLDELLDQGVPPEAARAELTRLLDALIPAHLLPAPWGTVAELLDGPVARVAVDLVLRLSDDKESRARRRALRRGR